MLSAVAARKAKASAIQPKEPNDLAELASDVAGSSAVVTEGLNDLDETKKRRASGSTLDNSINSNRKRRKSSKKDVGTPNRSGPSDTPALEVEENSASLERGKGARTPKAPMKGKRYFDDFAFEKTNPGANLYDQSSSEDELFGLEMMPQRQPNNGWPNGQSTTSQIAPVHASTKGKQRAWSPSNPIQGSESDSSEAEPFESRDVALPPSAEAAFIPPETPLSTWTPTSSNCYEVTTSSSTSSKLLLLKVDETATFLGVFVFSVLKGAIEYRGVKLPASSRNFEVFAPRCSPLSAIRSIAPDGLRSESSKVDLTSLPLDLQQLVESHEGSAILLSTLRTGIEGLGDVCGTFEGVFKPHRGYTGGVSMNMEGIVLMKDPHPQLQPFITLPSWQQTADSMLYVAQNEWSTKPAIYMTRGPKGSGKSTFNRLLCDNLLNVYRSVAVLDVDPGQPLLTPPGLLSLHIVRSHRFGPSFAFGPRPVNSHFFGGISPRSSVERWEELIRDLIQVWRLDWSYGAAEGDLNDGPNEDNLISSVIPLIINTHGWVKGYGAVLHRRLELMAEPTHIFTLSDSSAQEMMHPSADEANAISALNYTLEPLPPIRLTSRFTANDFRSISMLSYFHMIPNYKRKTSSQQHEPLVTWNTSIALCDVAPWEVSYGIDKAIRRIYLTGPWSDDVVPSEIARVLDCAIVGLMEVDEDELSSETVDTSITPMPYVQGDEAPAAEYSRCLGLAFIRAANGPSSSFHLLTPTDLPLLSKCRAIMKGELGMPLWGFLRFGEAPSADPPYLDWGVARGVRGGEKKRVRRNLMRKAQA